MTADLITARQAYARCQMVALCVLTTGGSRRLLETALARLMRARLELVAVETER